MSSYNSDRSSKSLTEKIEDDAKRIKELEELTVDLQDQLNALRKSQGMVEVKSNGPEKMKNKLKELTSTYVDGFTMGGLTYSIRGKYKIERFLWWIVILGMFAFTAYLVRDFVAALTKNETKFEGSIELVKTYIEYPMLTVCDEGGEGDQLKVFDDFYNLTNCKNNTKSPMCKNMVDHSANLFQSIEYSFHYEDSLMLIDNEQVFFCKVFNKNKDWRQRNRCFGKDRIACLEEKDKSESGLKLTWKPKEESFFKRAVMVIGEFDANDPKIKYIKPNTEVNINVYRSDIHLINSCKSDDQVRSIFQKSPVTEQDCLKTCLIEAWLFECQFIPYPLQTDIPTEWLSKQSLSYNTTRNKECYKRIEQLTQAEEYPLYNETCEDACTERDLCKQITTIETSIEITQIDPDDSPDEKRNDTFIRMKYTEPLMITKYKEEMKYSWEEVLAMLGGTLGLCTGTSFISVIEILLVLFFSIALCCKRK